MHIEGEHSHILCLTASCECSTYVLILAHEGRLRRRSRRWSEEWHPAAAAPLAAGAPALRPLWPGCEECAGTDPDASPVREKRPPGPKSPRWSAERRASPERRGRLTRALGAPQGTLRGCRSTRTLSRRSATPHFGCAKPKAKPGRKNAPRERRNMCCLTIE